MIFEHFLLEVNEANAYLVGCEETSEALLVDAGDWDVRIEQCLQDHALSLTKVFITHDHYDHTAGLRQAIAATGATAYSGSGTADGQHCRRLAHGDALAIGNIAGRVVATPGHTLEGICLIIPGMVFTGDALFAGSVGGTSSRVNADRQVAAIREHLFALPDHYEVHPGHGPSSTIAIERRHNPFFNP